MHVLNRIFNDNERIRVAQQVQVNGSQYLLPWAIFFAMVAIFATMADFEPLFESQSEFEILVMLM